MSLLEALITSLFLAVIPEPAPTLTPGEQYVEWCKEAQDPIECIWLASQAFPPKQY